MEDNSVDNNSGLQHTPDDDQWCFAWFATPDVPGKTRAAMAKAHMWQRGATITVSFLEGSLALRRRVQSIAEEWMLLNGGPANLRFSFIDEPVTRTDIRISFRYAGNWSAIGTTCKSETDPLKPTMNFGTIRETTPDAVARRVVLHEFGHAIGLVHEHQHPMAGIKWNRQQVFNDVSGPPNNWNLQKIERNIFRPYSQDETNHTIHVDNLSIMVYPIPAKWTTDGYSTKLNSELSEEDKAFVRQQYYQ